MTVSMLGDGALLVALAWQTYLLSDLPTALALVSLAITVPHIVCLLLGGVLSDRVQRRKLMMAADLVRGLAVAVIAVLATTGDLTIARLAALGAVYGAGTAFFGPAFDAIVPDIVPPQLLGQANALDQFVKPLMLRMAGPALGGLLIGLWGTGAAFAVDAATFGVSALALSLMTIDVVHERGENASVLADLKGGFGYVRSNVWLWGTLAAAAFAYLLFMGPAEVLLPFMVKKTLHGSASDLGLVFAIGGIGALTSALIMGRSAFPRRNMSFIYVVWTASTLMVAGYGFAHSMWHLMAASFCFNFLEAAGTIVWISTKQKLVPPALLGRVSSLDWLISIGLLPLSFALTGPISEAIGIRPTLIGAGALGALATLAAFLLPGVRNVEGRVHEWASAETPPEEGKSAA
jgi:DHA3 family tetracycline resistance protein-like MFS transporter